MISEYAPWFYWNLVGEVRWKLLDIIYDKPGFELIMDSGKTKLYARAQYPVMNYPEAIDDIVRLLDYVGYFNPIKQYLASNFKKRSGNKETGC